MVTAVILTKNEEKNIAQCLASVSWCQEIIVIDDYSTDKTVQIAKKAGATVLQHALDNNFSQQRNYGLAKAQGDWILFIDADEQVPESLATEILFVTSQVLHDCNAYYIKRIDFLFGKKLLHGETGDIKLLRLAKKGVGEWKGNVHETWQVYGKTQTLKHALYHYPHQTITEFLEEINFYTTLRSQELFDKKTPVSWWHIIVYPKAKFIVNYILKQGFRDGMPGIVISLMMSFHSFLVRGKLWYLYDMEKSS